MQAHHYKISLYYFSLHCSTCTWDMYMYDRCVGVERPRHGLHIQCSTVKTYNVEVAERSLIIVRLHTEAL